MKTNTQFLISLTFLFAGAAQAAVAPTIKAVSVTPTNAPAGTMFKFTAELKAPLTTGNKVKIDLGKGLASMTGTKTSYSLSRAIYTTGAQTYKVGIYNAKNVLQGKVNSGTYTVTSASPVNHAPTLTFISADKTATANQKYTITLNAKDVDANLSLITMNWGDSTAPDTLTATDGKDLVFSHTYATASSFALSAIATDKGTPSLNSKSVSKTVTVSNPVVLTSVKTTGYSKIANNGSELPDSAILGADPTDWACTKDNTTGLIWEVKTTDGGLRDWNNRYTWYEPDASKNGGFAGVQNGAICQGSQCDTYAFTNAVNGKGLCGKNDWRMPTIDELKGLLTKTSTIHQPLNDSLYINPTYFPNSFYWFWSSSPYAVNSGGAWYVNFYGDFSKDGSKSSSGNVRLVRSPKSTSVSNPAPVEVIEPPVKTTSYTKIANNGSGLPDSATLGTNSTDWACTKDNKTGLTWEIKTTDGGLRDWRSLYSWYEPNAKKNGGDAGYQNGDGHPEWCKGSYCDTYAFTNAVNAQGLCGANDWRMPTKNELSGLLTSTPTVNQPRNEKLYIDANYFPNTNYYWFWSSSPNDVYYGFASYVDFYYGLDGDDFKYGDAIVRLVR